MLDFQTDKKSEKITAKGNASGDLSITKEKGDDGRASRRRGDFSLEVLSFTLNRVWELSGPQMLWSASEIFYLIFRALGRFPCHCKGIQYPL